MKKEIKINETKTLALRIYEDESITLVSYKRCEKTAIWTEIESNLSIGEVVKLVDALCAQVKRLDNKLNCKKLEGEK